jgi:single-stranded DNA-binding protein
MDLNLVILAGRIAAEPEIRTFESGTTLMRLLVTVRSSEPRHRLDVVPVVQWDPDPDEIPRGSVRGLPVWVVGAVQRRFWSVGDGRHSRIEIVAHEVVVRSDEVRVAGEAPTAS